MLPGSVPVDLTWNAPAECPARDAVVDEVVRVLSASHEERLPVTARAKVSRDDSGRWHAVLSVSTREGQGERILEAESCPAIASATAVIVAIAVEGGMPDPVSPQAPPPEKPAQAAPPRVHQRASQLIAGVAAVIDASTWPTLAPAIEGTLGMAHSWSIWRVRAFASGSFFPTKDSGRLPPDNIEAPGEYGRFDLFAASAQACGSIVRGAFDVGPCLGAEIDAMTGTGQAPATPLTKTGSWVSVLGSLLAAWSFSDHFAVLLRGEGFYAPSAPPWFGVKTPTLDYIDVYRPARLGARGALGVEVRFF